MKPGIKGIIYSGTGLCAGLAAFAALEILAAAGISGYLALAALQGGMLGAVFGFAFGFSDAIIYKDLKPGLTAAAITAVSGAAAGAASLIIVSQGMMATANLLHPEKSLEAEILLPLWRSAGWMLTGGTLGAVSGIRNRSARRIFAGLLGGLAGGLAGGLFFEFIIRIKPGAPTAKAAGLLVLGLLTGISLSEFERRFSFAELRILNGKLKDRSCLLTRRKTAIGSSVLSDVRLYGYKNIPQVFIKRLEEDVCIEAGAEDPVLVNDSPLKGSRVLKYHDVIRLGDVKLLYRPLQ